MKQISLRQVKDNFSMVTIGNLDLYYSYETIVAFRDGHTLKGSQNVWSRTTGNHLNEIGISKDERIKAELFDKELKEVLAKHELNL